MSSEGARGTHFWGEEEAVFLLQQLKELNILKCLDGRKTRNGEVFKKVAKKMENAGFIRTPEQIRVKWKRMKRIYFITKKDSKRSGHNSVSCPHYELLEDLLGGRTLSQTLAHGLDVGFGASVSASVPEDQGEPTDDPEKHPDEGAAVKMEGTAETEERETASAPVSKTSTRTGTFAMFGERQRHRGRRSDVERFTSSMERLQAVLVDQLRQSQEMQERLVNSILQSNESMVSALLEGIQSLRPRPPDHRGGKDIQQLNGHQEERAPQPQGGTPTLKQEEPQPPDVKEEVEELWLTQEGERFLGPEEADLTKMPVKTEDHKDKPPESLRLHHSPHDWNREAEPPSNISQLVKTEADGGDCGGSHIDLLAPLSD
ncbi:uncharacterized protein LOC129179603 isoform X1 [Dunckerocampus dactyliophorus]|uniref:uncharacterized protein LOC129179603 isoform X1 n=1 Tax=Dunckerocampus dactyliophorus TaxID=161453 RepID=UPI002405375B|nr:uncharacterized protein LOC129179603 isoform X1 [Dunckerocampus dactyliophorus]